MTRTPAPSRPEALGVGVIGCGTIAHEHLRHLERSPLARLVSVCDRSPATARFAAERFGAETWHTDSATMLNAGALDVVHVLTPPATHPRLIREALDAGAHVVCEKPVAATATETAELVDAARGAGRALVESHNLLYNDTILGLDDLVAGGTLGEVREVEIALQLDLTKGPFGDTNLAGPGVSLPGGAVQDFAPHLAYLLLHLGGHHGPVDEVTGYLSNLSGNARVGFDHLEALVRFGEVRGVIRISSDIEPPGFGVAVRGTRGTATTDMYNPSLTVLTSGDSGKNAPLGQLRTGARVAASAVTNLRDKIAGHDTYHGLSRMLEAIYVALLDGVPPPITPDDIVDTAALVERLVELAEGER